jgi:hypothetical protein
MNNNGTAILNGLICSLKENEDHHKHTAMSLKLKSFTPIDEALQSNSEKDDNGCALLAISTAFNVKLSMVQELFKLEGRKIHEGCTNDQVKKVVKILATIKDKDLTYESTKNNPSLKSFVKAHRKGLYLINHKNHVSCLKDGVFIDDYLYFTIKYSNIFIKYNSYHLKIVGFWNITKKKKAKRQPFGWAYVTRH